MTYILGINAFHGDVAAVLLRDGQVVAALEEERFRRIKHYAGFPTAAIQRCLAIAGIDGSKVSHVAISRRPRANLWRKALFALSKRPSPSLVADRLRNSRRVGDISGPLASALGVSIDRLPRIHYVEHHPAHLASAFFVSGFDDAAVCAIDGFGDFVSTSTAVGSGTDLKILRKTYFPHSLGMMYTAVTQYLGFLGYGDEFKVMGLAPYGKPTAVSELRKLINLTNNGGFELNLPFFRHWKEGVEMEWTDGYPSLGVVFTEQLEALLGPARAPGAPLTSRHEDIARSLQVVHEDSVFHILNHLWEQTRNPRLCLAGGCAMNSVANGKIRERTPFRDLYIQPAAGDNGTALGAAYDAWHSTLGNARSFEMAHAYWGTSYDDAEIDALLAERADVLADFIQEQYGSDEAVCARTAELIADGNVIGWFQGRMEWGARALGNRSILADPRRADMRDLINTKIKFREKFRPFAPSIEASALNDYFVDAIPDPFMQQVYPVRPEKREVLPAITHNDGTGRIQTVTEKTNPLYHRLIQRFGALTGVPIILNTSFNENEPIVDTPSQALDCFLRTRMDVIVLGRRVIRRSSSGNVGSPT